MTSTINFFITVINLVIGGLFALEEYIALHAVIRLIPSFLLAGAIVRFIPKGAVIGSVGPAANKLKSFGLAAVSSSFAAVCSCAVVPMASGVYAQGACVGAAFILLWVAPAANVLALSYTGSILGVQMAVCRAAAALSIALIIGIVMSVAFRKDQRPESAVRPQEENRTVSRKDLTLLVLITLSLTLPDYAVQRGPYLYKAIIWIAATSAVYLYAFKAKTPYEISEWHEEAWRFARSIFPFLILGVFAIGVIGELLPDDFMRRYLSGSSVRASFLATALGGIMYFAPMTEGPFVSMMLKMGMGKGPALALLLAGSGMSLPGMLAIGRVFGIRKAFTYIGLVAALGTFAGWFFGQFVF